MKKLISSPFIIISMIMILMNVNYSGSTGLEGLNFDLDDSLLLNAPMVDDEDEGGNLLNVGEPLQLPNREYRFHVSRGWSQFKIEQQFCEHYNAWHELQNIKDPAVLQQLCVDFSLWKIVIPNQTRKCTRSFQMNYARKKKCPVTLQNGTYMMYRIMLCCNCYDQSTNFAPKENEHTFVVAKHNDTFYYYLTYDNNKYGVYIFGYVNIIST